MIRRFASRSLRSRACIVASLVLAALAGVAEGVSFFDSSDDSAFGAALTAFAILMAVAGIAVTLQTNPFSSVRDDGAPTPTSAANRTFLHLSLDSVPALIVVAIVGIVMFVVSFASGSQTDWTVVFAPLLIGVFGGAVCMLIGMLAALIVVWPIGLIVAAISDRATGKPVHPFVPAFATLLLTIVAFAVLGTLGSNAPDVIGTPSGRGLFQIIYLYVDYSGTAAQQILAWIARPLIIVIVLEVLWLRAIGKAARGGRSKG